MGLGVPRLDTSPCATAERFPICSIIAAASRDTCPQGARWRAAWLSTTMGCVNNRCTLGWTCAAHRAAGVSTQHCSVGLALGRQVSRGGWCVVRGGVRFFSILRTSICRRSAGALGLSWDQQRQGGEGVGGGPPGRAPGAQLLSLLLSLHHNHRVLPRKALSAQTLGRRAKKAGGKHTLLKPDSDSGARELRRVGGAPYRLGP